MAIYLSLLVCLVGVVLYGATNGKASEVGRMMFWCGLLAFLLTWPQTVVAVVHTR